MMVQTWSQVEVWERPDCDDIVIVWSDDLTHDDTRTVVLADRVLGMKDFQMVVSDMLWWGAPDNADVIPARQAEDTMRVWNLVGRWRLTTTEKALAPF